MTKLGRPIVKSIDEREREIFMIAERLFGERGFAQVTMSEIASEVGMSKKTLYKIFSDKAQLLASLVSSSYSWRVDFDDIELLENVDFKSKIQTCLFKIAEHVLSKRHINLCRLAISEHIQSTEMIETFYEHGVEQSRNDLIQILQNNVAMFAMPNLNAEIMADMLFGACIAKPFIDTLFMNKDVELSLVQKNIQISVQTLFKTES